jgi:hypothetical protein
MMARESGIEQLSVVVDPWNLELKPAKLKSDPFLRGVDLGRIFTLDN